MIDDDFPCCSCGDLGCTHCDVDDADDDDDPVCCRCGQPATDFYDDREDCPSCGKASCELWMQGGLDYIDERGG